jgi:hypothetical protein
MGSDNRDKKPFNYRAAQCVLHCNNCITIVLAIILLVAGFIGNVEVYKASIKFKLCSEIGGATVMASMMTKLLKSNGTAEVDTYCGGASAGGLDGGSGHCNAHTDCKLGHYCDEDYVCWDCSYVMDYGKPGRGRGYTTEPNPETDSGVNCDAFDAINELRANRPPCLRCVDEATNPLKLRRSDSDTTVESDVAAPEAASFVSSYARLMIFLGGCIAVSALFGFAGDAYHRRELLFVHHFVVLLLALTSLYAIAFCWYWSDTAGQMLRSYWPWLRQSFPRKMQVKDATNLLDHRVRGSIAMFCLVSMSLWSGVVASARLLGLKMLAKQMLIITNILIALLGLVCSVASIALLLSGFSYVMVVALALVGGLIGALGIFGFVGAYTERAGLLKTQMCCTYPTAALVLLLGLECAFWDKLDLKSKGANIGKKLRDMGRMSDNQAVESLHSHYVLLGLFAIMAGVFMVLNLCCTKVLIQRLQLDGRGYAPVSAEDLDEDYGPEGGDVERGAQKRKAPQTLEMQQMQDFEIGDEEDDA